MAEITNGLKNSAFELLVMEQIPILILFSVSEETKKLFITRIGIGKLKIMVRKF